MGLLIRLIRVVLIVALLCIVPTQLYDFDTTSSLPTVATREPAGVIAPPQTTPPSRPSPAPNIIPEGENSKQLTEKSALQKETASEIHPKSFDRILFSDSTEQGAGQSAKRLLDLSVLASAGTAMMDENSQMYADRSSVSPSTTTSRPVPQLVPESVDRTNPPVTESTDGRPDTPSAPDGDSQPYVDRLIDGGMADDADEPFAREDFKRLKGDLSFFSLTYRYYTDHSDLAGTLNEHGVGMVARKDTVNYGNYELLADGLLTDERDDEYIEGGRILLSQQSFVINDSWQMDSDIGHYRTQTPRLISNSYKFYLPSTLLQGLSAQWYDQRTTLYVSAGEIGALNGTAARAFELTQGSLLGAGLTHEFDDRWSTGFQFWNTVESIDTETHQSYAGVVQYEPAEMSQLHQLHFLIDSNSQSGLWFDSEIRQNRWLHNLGLFYFEPELLWTDVLINNDRAGVYWRGDRRTFRWQWALGTEISKNNLDNNENLAGFISTASFVNGNWRYRRHTSFGGTFNLTTQHADSGTAEDDSYRYSVRGFMNRQYAFGTTRLQARASILDSGIDRTEACGFLWDQVWNVPFFRRLNTDIEYVLQEDEPDEVSLRLVLEKDIGNDIWFNGSAQYIYAGSQGNNRKNAANASISANWQFYENWKLSLSADYNRNEFEDSVGLDESVENNTLLLSLSYAVSGGRQTTVYGRDTGSLGRGQVAGKVFLDENRNGRHDLGETVLEGIAVILDHQFSKETDANGEFEFWPVSGGDHVITILVEEVPLPWGLEDEAPRKIIVPVRGRATVDFGLVKLDE